MSLKKGISKEWMKSIYKTSKELAEPMVARFTRSTTTITLILSAEPGIGLPPERFKPSGNASRIRIPP